MEAIFHEKHCLNALLQNQLFTAVDLAQIGQRLDEQERQHMLEGGVDSREYQHFLEQPSSNYDDSGFFSIQVLQEALRVWGLELVPFTSQNPIAHAAREDPTSQQAYICNFRQHWFCVRKLGNQWFNLNSLLTGPELISNTYLSLFLTQLQQEAVQPIKPSLITAEGSGGGTREPGEEEEQDQYLQRALAESRRIIEQDDSTLQQALRESMAGYIEESIQRGGEASSSGTSSSSSSANTLPAATQNPTPEELRQRRLAFLEGANRPIQSAGTPVEANRNSNQDEPSEEAMLQEALRMSMEQPE
ncbi:hypothetical protein BaRGS_00003927 [Batillaria attramentaria]|uniref:ubiquitinyl hydrolase 1 n=1 Tax=Batillaria attramentaria TaxID=370345 RepID=A0ABD0LZJ7_9CAEN